MATLGCHIRQSQLGGTSGSENLQVLVIAGIEQSLGGPAEVGAPSPRLPAVVRGEKTADMRREAAPGQMLSSASDWGGKLGRAVQLEHAEYNAGNQFWGEDYVEEAVTFMLFPPVDKGNTR